MKFLSVITIAFIAILAAPESQARKWTELQCGPDWGPKEQVSPVYPRRAQQRGVEGYIVMGFSIAQDGTIEDISVIEANPAKAFVRSATQAVSSLEFPPCVQNGIATRQTDISVKFDFNLSKGS